MVSYLNRYSNVKTLTILKSKFKINSKGTMDSSECFNPLAATGHLSLVKSLWLQTLIPGKDIAIDATSGNGLDSLYLARYLSVNYC